MGTIKIAIAGIGNCASALIQGIEYYKRSKDTAGLKHKSLGGYGIYDIDVVAAFDIDERKVGRHLNEAIVAKPNCTKIFYPGVQTSDMVVKMGNPLDGASDMVRNPEYEKNVALSKQEPCDIIEELKRSKADMLLNYLPVGSIGATEFYADACLRAGVAFINNIPVFIASSSTWEKRFRERNLPVIGDDVKSQVGATAIHRILAWLLATKGASIDKTYQLNVGGNTDFLNMLDESRAELKYLSKTDAIQSLLKQPLPVNEIRVCSSNYVPWMDDTKVSFIQLRGTIFGGIPVTIDVRLEVEDSPNSAGVVIDVIRCCKLALDRRIGGALTSVAAYAMKHPPVQYPDHEADVLLEKFINGEIDR